MFFLSSLLLLLLPLLVLSQSQTTTQSDLKDASILIESVVVSSNSGASSSIGSTYGNRIYLIRHGEKPLDSNDPNLSPAGVVRADNCIPSVGFLLLFPVVCC